MPKVIKHELVQRGKRPVSAYVRVSTDKDEQEESYHCQKDYWSKKLGSDENLELIAVYGDEGISGRSQKKRPQFQEMITDALLGKFKTIYTKSLARFGRNATETIEAIQALRDVGVNIIFESNKLDTKHLSNELFVKIRAILAESESDNISANVKWSYTKRFKQGILNTLQFCYGYNIISDTDWRINEKEAGVVKMIYDLYLNGNGAVKIVHYLKEQGIPSPKGNKVWSVTTIKSMLENEKYTGNMLLQKTYTKGVKQMRNNGEVKQYFVENTHPAIISGTTFEMVRHEREKRREKIGEHIATPKEYEFSRKISCGLCGKGFKRRTNNKIKNFSKIGWICGTANIHGIKECGANQIQDDLLKEIVVDAFNEYLDTPKKTAKIEKANADIAELIGKEKGFRELMKKGLITYAQFSDEQIIIKAEYDRLEAIITEEQGDGLYKKEGTKRTEYSEDIVDGHIENITLKGYAITFTFKNQQQIKKRYKYEHRRYCKDYD